MIRLGLPEENAGRFIRRVMDSQEIDLEGIFTHCPLAEEPDNSFTVEQFERFMRIVSSLPDLPESVKLHAANSAAVLDFPQTHLDLVRPGILCYGHYPSDEVRRAVEVRPALELKSQIIDIKRIEPGTGIGYGHLFKPKREMLVATIPIGYADGYNRLHSFSGEALIRGRRCPIVGAVSMDFTMIGIPEDLDVEMQDVATLIGRDGDEEITVSELARKLSTIPYEIFCLIGDRVYREYLHEPRQD
jgi:alanine racemase